MKPKLLVLELWRIGDLVIAAPFLQAAPAQFEVTLIAQPVAGRLQPRLFPDVKLLPFVAPWTVFEGKYRLLTWPWRKINQLRCQARAERFDFAVSARWDTREHLLMAVLGAKHRLGFPRLGSRLFLTQPLARLSPLAHRYDDWWVAACAIGLFLPPRAQVRLGSPHSGRTITIHTGAYKPVRVWPLDRYQRLAQHLRQRGFNVRILCDDHQRAWWQQCGETAVQTPATPEELLALLDQSAVFIGNDSGPGHLAAACGVPTFTFFGPQLSEWFAPLHPDAEWIDGKPCPFRQCFDRCRFPTPRCLWEITEEEARHRIDAFVSRLFRE
jgi:ADP-heptose:LPS heptosyltransferase